MTEQESLAIANETVQLHGLTAEFIGEVRSVGVGGDLRTYTRIIVLIGPYPGEQVLSLLSSQIGNRTGINRITFELARRT